MTRTRGFTMPMTRWLAIAGIPVAMFGCQNQGNSETPAGSPPMAAQPSPARLDDTTKTNVLLRQIHAANQEEIELGKLAADKAQNAEVRKFADDMVTDHTNADQKLTDLAKRTNLDLNATPHDPVEHALQEASDDCKRSLKGMSGAQFDVAYIAPQVDKHIFALQLVEDAQKTATGDAKKFLDEARSTVESHMDHAKNLMRGLSFSPAAVGGGPGSERAAEKNESMPGGVSAGKGDGGHRGEVRKERMKPLTP